ncbi:MAG: alpha/beta hydrolase [Pseudomonadota bacterium]
MRAVKSIALSIATATLAACTAVPDLDTRRAAALASAPGALTEIFIPTRSFDLAAFLPSGFVQVDSGTVLTVYIEGDGLAWITRSRPSDDPTPTTPLVMSLMSSDERMPTAYLARPCQYVGAKSRNCEAKYWTNRRFAPEVVSSMNEAISALKARAPRTRTVRLIGFSGGGVIAALIAARRQDIDGLVTIAAPMDINAFTTHHGVSSLSGSLDPVAEKVILSDIPQIHFVGGQDTVVPRSVVESYLRSLGTTPCASLVTIPSASHVSGWRDISATIHAAAPRCEAEAT